MQLAEALCNQPKGGGFHSRRGHWDFSLNLFFVPQYDLAVDIACNRNAYQEYLLRGKGSLGMTNLPSSFVECLEILAASNFCSP